MTNISAEIRLARLLILNRIWKVAVLWKASDNYGIVSLDLWLRKPGIWILEPIALIFENSIISFNIGIK